MNPVKSLYDSKYLGFALVTPLYLLQHVQTMAYMRYAQENENEEDSKEWNSDARDLWDELDDIALRIDGDDWFACYIAFYVIIGVSFILYLIFADYIHRENAKKYSWLAPVLWLFDYGVYGGLYIPMISVYTDIEYCDHGEELFVDLDDYDCYDDGHVAMVFFSIFSIGIIYFFAGVVCPILKSERNGVERRWENESAFLPMYRLLQISVVMLFGPLRVPEAGLVITILLMLYLVWYECFAELHIASMHMAILCAQMWVFACATVDDVDTASNMLAGWAPFLVLGYVILPIKAQIFKRSPKILPYEK
jgi:hypothetical protein